jgi:hypothetical protein
MQLTRTVSTAEQYFFDVVEKGSDQELFIAGYVQGHFSLALAQLQAHENRTVEQFKNIISVNLDQAFAAQELELKDQLQARALVEQLFE